MLQREWSAIAQQVPGFAGMFLDDQGNMVVRTVDMSEEQALQRATQPMLEQYRDLGDQRRTPLSRTTVQPADYSFVQLVRWHNAILRDMRGTTGFTSIYIDYEDNRIGIGVAPEHEASARTAGLAAARDNGVPEDAVFFRPLTITTDIGRGAPPAVARTHHTLANAQDPLVGGLRVSSDYLRPLDSWCTLTLVVRWPEDDDKMWLTNAHCTRRVGAINTEDAWYQPFWSNGVIGYEAVDRLFDGGTLGFDEHGYADASMQVATIYNPERDAAIGMIARTIDAKRGIRNRGSLVIADNTNPRRVKGLQTPIQGMTVYKTGATTGTTVGEITEVDVFYPRNDPGAGLWEMREQVNATYWSEGGDSGSPVYSFRSDGDINIVGQHWGHELPRDDPNNFAIFSRWPQVEHHVARLVGLCETVSCE